MELDFDKEIDAILRNAQRDGPVLVGDAAATRHLDADDIAAFAENAVPDKSRALYTRHLADCDRCRKVLSNQLMMSGDAAPIVVAAPAASSTITIAERDLPWYRKFLLFPNLAYVMGGLVLVFGGFLAFSVIQNSRLDTGGMLSQAPEAENRQGGPNATTEAAVPMANAAANTANVATSEVALNANSDASSGSRPAEPGIAGPRTAENFLADGTDSTMAPPPPPPASAAAGQAVEKDRDDKAKEARAVAGNAPVQETKNEALLSQQKGMNTQTQSGPSRNSDNQYRAQLEKMDSRAAAKRAVRDEESSGRRVVGGRTFERKQDVWYDIAYQSRPTINVRRGTEEFNRLDAGLRSIANSLGGTIVVVWGAKAYRIN